EAAAAQEHLGLLAELASSVPAFRLTLGHNPKHLPSLVETALRRTGNRARGLSKGPVTPQRRRSCRLGWRSARPTFRNRPTSNGSLWPWRRLRSGRVAARADVEDRPRGHGSSRSE